MTAPWAMGRDKIAELLGKRHLEQISGAAANGEFLLKQARTRLAGARAAKEADPAGAFALAYDGMRQAVTALLIQQGLRPRTEGGHVAIIEAAQAQFGQSFASFNTMRRVRNQLEYPRDPEELEFDPADTDDAIDKTETAIEAVEQLLPRLGLWQ
ncbi:hypothetical protein MycrhDRAFT_5624 [Mycolicibacterium rhodesiae JS60]|nr:hypothetical protein MycrhDRAFT_5624 [Mycolicibacterium rhodesiae JS60]